MIVGTKKIKFKNSPILSNLRRKKFTTKLKIDEFGVLSYRNWGNFVKTGIPRLFEVVVGGLWGEVMLNKVSM